jgi:hypothetical protein
VATSNEYTNDSVSELERQDRQYLMAEHEDEQANERLQASGDDEDEDDGVPAYGFEDEDEDEGEDEPVDEEPEPVEPVNSATAHEGGIEDETTPAPVTETTPTQAPLSELKRARKAAKPKAKTTKAKAKKSPKSAKKTATAKKKAVKGGKAKKSSNRKK